MPINSFENYPMSWKPKKEKLSSPFYLSIANILEQDIINGSLEPNVKLPPQRELADYLDLNLSTITRAFKICELKGLIYAVVGRGTFVSPNASCDISITDNKIEKNYIELGVIRPLDQTNSIVSNVIKDVLSKSYIENLLDYGNPSGLKHHKLSAQSWLQRYNLNAKLDNIAITSGSQNSITLSLISLFKPGDKIAIDMYTYPNVIELANMLNIQLIPIEGDMYGMNPDALKLQCILNNIKGVYLIPSCSNPTAILMNMERRKDIANVINEYSLILIEDDIYSFLAPQNFIPITCLVPENSIYICSTSKSLCSGLRIAFMVYPSKFSSTIERVIYNVNIKTSSLNVEIISEMINTGVADKIIEEKKSIIKHRNNIYKKYFDIYNPNENPLSFFKWLPLKPHLNSFEIKKEATENGLRIYHSKRFLVGNDNEKQFLRISLSSTFKASELDNGLRILKNIISK